MKQKIVIKMQLHGGKCRSKAMQIASVADGVTSVAIEGEDKDRVVVIGDGVDSASLANSLRKKVGYADIISVEEVKAKFHLYITGLFFFGLELLEDIGRTNILVDLVEGKSLDKVANKGILTTNQSQLT
ncbi:hypothetical protein F0562_032144 [Nyssa sinensis]|uniref:HMA domain-containing protein n=1 Tax=Nyssa sinensis TaxID=561372 RepID=A0A5J5AYN2_9ASTE|nr:hypothetical protein F0562_032144 [Nyssa sinensis]